MENDYRLKYLADKQQMIRCEIRVRAYPKYWSSPVVRRVRDVRNGWAGPGMAGNLIDEEFLRCNTIIAQ